MTKYICDTCGKPGNKALTMQVIKAIKEEPDFVMQHCDLCNDCYSRALSGDYIFCHGFQQFSFYNKQ